MGKRICVCIATLLLTIAAPALGYGEWLFPVTQLETADSNNTYVVIDSLGNGIATWLTYLSGIYARNYNRASRSWDATVTEITPLNTLYFYIAMNGAGNAVASWQVSTRVEARLYDTATNSWLATSTLFAGIEFTNDISAAIAPTNNALSIWNNVDSSFTNYFIQGAHYNGSSWETATIISPLGNDALYPHVVMDNAGNGIAVWALYATNYRVQTRRYIAGSGWDPAGTTTLSAPGQDALDPQVAVNGAGNAFAIWNRYDGANYRIEVVRYTTGSGWDIANTATLSAAGQDMNYPQIAMDPTGNAIAVWQNDTTGLIQASRYDAGTSIWSTAININATGVSTRPQIGMDASGNGIAVWNQASGGQYIQSSYYKKITNTWGPSTTLAGPSTSIPQLKIAMSSSGSALSSWIFKVGSPFFPQAIYFDGDPAYPMCLKCYLLTQEYILNKLAQP